VDGFLAVVTESTARLVRERERAHIFDTTLSAIVDFAYSFDRQGRFLYVNKALLDLWGLQLADAVGKNFFDLNYPPELAGRLQRQIEEVFVGKKVLRDETRYVSPSGVEGYYEYIFSPVLGADGVVTVVAGSTRDITQRVKLERKLIDVHARMETTLAAGAIGTWSWDVVANRMVADHILARFFSVSEEDANGGTIESYMRAVHPEDRASFAQKIQDVLADGSTYEAEYRLMNAEGGIRWVVARASIMRDAEGNAVTMPGMVIDITERKHLEQRLRETIDDLRTTQLALEKQAGELESQVKERTARLQETVATLEAFSYSISHDLRGPLRVMQNFAEALREDCGHAVGAAGADYIRRIVGAAVRMDRIIQDVLGYSRISRSDLTLERMPLDEFVRGLLESYPAFHDHKTNITVDGLLPVVMANPAAVTQCLANLIGNAVKFVAPGVRPAVRISARTDDARAFISVADNGIGIPAAAHESIFNAFYRHESGYEGTGIGLAIVRKAIERLGGRITVDSKPGSGSTFTFDLPLAVNT
jgi:PAS domain S-box-containing protein